MPHSFLAAPSATLTVLRRHGLAVKKQLGQHFLIDDNVVGRILDLADPVGDEVALEIGPGIGTLTVALCQRVDAVVAVERDAGLLPVLAETTSECRRVEIVHADAATVEPRLIAESFGPPATLVANLPYAVAATVVLRFFETLPSLRSVTVMVQAEVADRMSAQPGSKDYGSYSVKLQLLARPGGKFPVSRTCFLPPPRVDSAVLRLVREPVVQDQALLAAAARAADAAFAHRRKTIRNSLAGSLGFSAALVDGLLASAGIDPSSRAETLPVQGFVSLGAAMLEESL